MLLEEAKKILEDNGYRVLNENVDLFSLASSLVYYVGSFFIFYEAMCALGRGIRSHFDTRKLKDILKKCENNKEDFAEETVELIQKKIIHRPITDLNDDELAEAIEKLLKYISHGGLHDSVYMYKDDDTKDVYNDEGYIKDKIKDNLDVVYNVLFDLMFDLVKYHFETNPNKTKEYEKRIYNSCEKIYYMTTKIGNLRRAFYVICKGTKNNDENFTDYIKKRTWKNYNFNKDENGEVFNCKNGVPIYYTRKPYKNDLKSIKP